MSLEEHLQTFDRLGSFRMDDEGIRRDRRTEIEESERKNVQGEERNELQLRGNVERRSADVLNRQQKHRWRRRRRRRKGRQWWRKSDGKTFVAIVERRIDVHVDDRVSRLDRRRIFFAQHAHQFGQEPFDFRTRLVLILVREEMHDLLVQRRLEVRR